jgi:REP element-mobilizing transposase RayT
MPCYLFTYHAYGTWLPGRKQGYVKRGRGILPTNAHMHRLYAAALKEDVVKLQETHQLQVINSLLESQAPQHFDVHYAATDATHVHGIVAWRDDRNALKLRGLIKSSLTRSFNGAFHRRTWFAEGASRKQIRDREHYDYLVNVYLPKHNGWKWSQGRGLFQ